MGIAYPNKQIMALAAGALLCSPSALMRQSEGLHERRISGSS
jgi:hypothetical protein